MGNVMGDPSLPVRPPPYFVPVYDITTVDLSPPVTCPSSFSVSSMSRVLVLSRASAEDFRCCLWVFLPHCILHIKGLGEGLSLINCRQQQAHQDADYTNHYEAAGRCIQLDIGEGMEL